MMSIQNEFSINIAINIVAIAFMAGIYIQTIKTVKDNQEKSETDNKERISDLKKYFLEKIEDVKTHFAEHLNRVEEKQDKHNNLIERMAIVEQSVKSAHHRVDEMKDNLKKNEVQNGIK